VVVVVAVAVVLLTTSTTEDLMLLTQHSLVVIEISVDKLTCLVVTLHLTLVLVVVVAHTTTQTTMVELAVQALWSSVTKSELYLNDKLLYGGL
jgi:hypothetical protein